MMSQDDRTSSIEHTRAELETSHERRQIVTAPEDRRGRVLAILGGAERKGAWEPPARLDVIAIMGGVELDFTEADLLEGETVVEVLAIMGGVKIIVPGDIDIESGSGLGIMGGFASVSHRADSDDDPPLLRIRGVALMGGVEIKFK